MNATFLKSGLDDLIGLLVVIVWIVGAGLSAVRKKDAKKAAKPGSAAPSGLLDLLKQLGLAPEGEQVHPQNGMVPLEPKRASVPKTASQGGVTSRWGGGERVAVEAAVTGTRPATEDISTQPPPFQKQALRSVLPRIRMGRSRATMFPSVRLQPRMTTPRNASGIQAIRGRESLRQAMIHRIVLGPPPSLMR